MFPVPTRVERGRKEMVRTAIHRAPVPVGAAYDRPESWARTLGSAGGRPRRLTAGAEGGGGMRRAVGSAEEVHSLRVARVPLRPPHSSDGCLGCGGRWAAPSAGIACWGGRPAKKTRERAQGIIKLMETQPHNERTEEQDLEAEANERESARTKDREGARGRGKASVSGAPYNPDGLLVPRARAGCRIY
ncbi:unnamed protein product [Prorocentrum cordatum]|uniref:Uncharacterized protein n=1 Tax=Prorocentrum cordatum TaxID=2364126 RepID=A0ABN9VWI5_9DINO|nr:unnamed protein product [Polarella glacialis]